MQTIEFSAEARNVGEKSQNLRKNGQIPAVLYGDGVLEHFSVTHNNIKKLIYTPDFKIGQVEVGGQTHKCIVKDIQWHPIKDTIEHIDFIALKEGVKVKVEVPVVFEGTSPGVIEGGKLMQTLRRIKIKVDPKYLVDQLVIDISNLKLNEAVRVRDITHDENIEIMVNEAVPVATVEVPRALKSAQAEQEAATPGEAEAPADAAKE